MHLDIGDNSPVKQVEKSLYADDPIIDKNLVVATFGSFSEAGKLGVEASRENKGIDGSPFNFAVALNVGAKAVKLSWIGGALATRAKGEGGLGSLEPAQWIKNRGGIRQLVTSEHYTPEWTATGYLTNAFNFIDETLDTRLRQALKEI